MVSRKLVKVLVVIMIVVSLLWCEAGCVFVRTEPAYAAAKKKKPAKKKTSKSLTSQSSKASASNLAFDRIFIDYEANPDATSRKWKGQVITIEGTLVDVDTSRSDPLLMLMKPGFEKWVYMFSLSSNFPMELYFSTVASAKLSLGQNVKLKGKVLGMKKDDGIILVACTDAEFTQLRAWRCSKCGMIRTKVIEGQELSDLTAGTARCERGGVHDWRRVK